VEEAAARRRGEVGEDGGAARGLAEERHLGRVAAEGGGVLRDPPHRQLLVEDAEIAAHSARVGRSELLQRGKAERAEAVVHRDQHRPPAAAADQVLDRAVRGDGPLDERAAVQPDKDAEPGGGVAERGDGSEDVERQALLGDGRRAVRRFHARAARSVGQGIQYAVPAGGGRRRQEAASFAEGNAAKGGDATRLRPPLHDTAAGASSDGRALLLDSLLLDSQDSGAGAGAPRACEEEEQTQNNQAAMAVRGRLAVVHPAAVQPFSDGALGRRGAEQWPRVHASDTLQI